MPLTVNADDFGKDDSVNMAICRAFEEGLIDRTTLMTNMPGAPAAMTLAAQKGFAGRVGVHLNLTSGRPLSTGIASDPVMCNGAGEFSADFARNMRTRFYLPKKTRKNVEMELRAQLDRYRELGGTLWHIDSHHFVHTDPSVWFVLKRVLRDYPVTGVRLGRNMYRGGNQLMHLYKFILNSSIKRFCKGHPAYFGSAVDYECFTVKGGVPDPGKEVEVMVHPVFDINGKLVDTFEGKDYQLKKLH